MKRLNAGLRFPLPARNCLFCSDEHFRLAATQFHCIASKTAAGLPHSRLCGGGDSLLQFRRFREHRPERHGRTEEGCKENY